ncbi:MAG TPA: caspase family protein, partial [Abditibacteriaceae bacterium]
MNFRPFLLSSLLFVPVLAPAHAAPKSPAKPAARAPQSTAKKPSTPAKAPASKPAKPQSAVPQPVAQPEPVVPPVEAGPKTWALLIGVGKYTNPQISSLRFPPVDAAAIRTALADKKLGNIPENQILLLTDGDATREKIHGAVDGFLKDKVGEGDKIILFLAGHGIAKGVGASARSYLLPSDVKGLSTEALKDSAVDLRELSTKLGQLPASQFVIFVDACREDPTPGRGIKGNTLSDVMSRGLQITPADTSRPFSAATFFACGVGQRAYEDPRLNHGVFTYWILNGIKEAAIPQRPDGAVDMGRLSSYVSTQVREWAKKTSADGDFEVEQNPEVVISALDEPIVLMKVQRNLPENPLPAAKPSISVLSNPEGATVTLNGQKIGATPISMPLEEGREYKLRVESKSYEPQERTIRALAGYEQQVIMQLKPAGRGVTSPMGAQSEAFFQSALDAEKREQWDVAAMNYTAVLTGDPTFAPAYENLADLQARRGDEAAAIGTLVKFAQSAPSSHSLSLLSRAYAEYALKNAANEKSKKPKKIDLAYR